MISNQFPLEDYLDTIVRLLDTIQYRDDNYSHEERATNLRFAYLAAVEHFSEPRRLEILKVNPKRLAASLKTIVAMVVYAWTKVSPEVMAALSIHYTYTLILDDMTDDPHLDMTSYYEDLLSGKEQKHGWWRLVNEHMPEVLKHFGGFCALNMVRSTIDFFEGCWIEQYNFQGFPGSHDYPLFLRRMNGLGHCVGASLFPSAQFREEVLFVEITTAIAQMENWMVFVNDMLSFYKEYDDLRDQTNLVRNYARCDGTSVNEALEKLTRDTLHSTSQMMSVFDETKDASVVGTLRSFVQGYVTWHLCDPRYRLAEIFEIVGDSPNGRKFKQYVESARAVGIVPDEEWALPSLLTLAKKKAAKAGKIQNGVAPYALQNGQ